MGDPIFILLVEDNPADIKLTRLAFEKLKIQNEIFAVQDGVEAIKYLRKQGEYGNAARPDLILLDLNLPKKNGREVLKEIKEDPELRTIPVLILTSSSEERDIHETYHNHANSFITKPVDLGSFNSVVNSIETFWFTIVKLPKVN
ncbi:MAG: response regulator [Candidatus Obscuribacterales bacterium]|nr:response regulator [Candidatus Obscuribacterales bacterium]